MKKIKLLIISLFIIFSSSTLIADDFNDWKIKFKKRAINEGISKYTVNNLIDNSKFLPDVIKYDRYQPEFYNRKYIICISNFRNRMHVFRDFPCSFR